MEDEREQMENARWNVADKRVRTHDRRRQETGGENVRAK